MFLVAYDGLPAAKLAVQHAALLVGRGGELAVINVVPVQSVSSRLETVSDRERAWQARILGDAKVELQREDVEPQLIAAAGDPAREVIAAAEAMKAETIVVGRSHRRHLMHGPLASRLVRRAHCDVLVVGTDSSSADGEQGVRTRRASREPRLS